jgi:hypothetical protein
MKPPGPTNTHEEAAKRKRPEVFPTNIWLVIIINFYVYPLIHTYAIHKGDQSKEKGKWSVITYSHI